VDDQIAIAVATARAFQERSGALRVVLLLDHDGDAVMIDCTDTVTVTEGDTTTEATPTAPPKARSTSRSCSPARSSGSPGPRWSRS